MMRAKKPRRRNIKSNHEGCRKATLVPPVSEQLICFIDNCGWRSVASGLYYLLFSCGISIAQLIWAAGVVPALALVRRNALGLALWGDDRRVKSRTIVATVSLWYAAWKVVASCFEFRASAFLSDQNLVCPCAASKRSKRSMFVCCCYFDVCCCSLMY